VQRIDLYDTTLRDGAQGEGVVFSLEDKLRITQRLDALGIHFIEGGWPGSNPKDAAYFAEVRALPLQTATIAAFGTGAPTPTRGTTRTFACCSMLPRQW
jgi:2-isopropylmalate synthase